MTRRNRQDLAPSLFPFLAVLVCTLGTLILLLALLAESSATAAEQKAREAISEKLVEVTPDPEHPSHRQAAAMIDEAAFHIQAIESIRSKQAAVLEERRDQLTHLENHIRQLQTSLKRLSGEIENATADAPTNQIDSATIAMLRDQIAQEQLAVEQLKAEKGSQAPRVVIVPHKGPNGTTRRPIYVECTAEGLTIWPEGVKIQTDQLVDRRTRLANPLDAALRVARLHIMEVYGDTDPPYPLLVVRPHGTESYFQATTAMDDWDDQYGYEMLDSDIQLAFSASDPNLKKRMEQAIKQALDRQSDRRTTRAVVLSASDLARNGQSLGFSQQPNHGYGAGSGDNDFAQQANRLNDIYRDAAQELRSRDGQLGDAGTSGLAGENLRNQTSDPSGSEAVRQSEHPANAQSSQAKSPNNDGVRQTEPENAPHTPTDSISTGSTASDASLPKSQQTATSSSQAAAGNSATATSAMVQRDGDNWALPSNVAHATGIAIVRTISMQMHADRFVVPATRGETERVIPFRGNIDRASLELATVLRDRIERWGVALDNGRWEPRLEVAVIDNDSLPLERLKQLLRGSGIEITEKSAH